MRALDSVPNYLWQSSWILDEIVEFYGPEVFSISSSLIVLCCITKHSRRPEPRFFTYSVNIPAKTFYCWAKVHHIVIELEHNSALKTRPCYKVSVLSQEDNKFLLWIQMVQVMPARSIAMSEHRLCDEKTTFNRGNMNLSHFWWMKKGNLSLPLCGLNHWHIVFSKDITTWLFTSVKLNKNTHSSFWGIDV